MTEEKLAIKHFIEQRIEQDLEAQTYAGNVITRFPPEPNGYLHIGHAKSMCLNFGMAEQYQGRCHLRFDDTNPAKEEHEFMVAIQEDVKWLGFQWDSLHNTSEYFEQLYDYAVQFIQQGKAYVCSLCPAEIRDYRGTLTEPGKNSPYRERSIEENLELFQQMKMGAFPEGSHVLRAKIDMAAGNINLRDPVMYRILHLAHPHIGEKWCIYPTYDFAHCFSDAIENITHSLCTLEFQDHRPLYDWFLAQVCSEPRPQQIEFSKLNLSHTLMSKRKLKQLVEERTISGWDDPRLVTLVGLRRRGFTPNAIKSFCRQIGISKAESVIDMSLLEEAVRQDLNVHAWRAMCVLDPIKVTIKNLPNDHLEWLTVPNHPQNDAAGTRTMPFTSTVWIERSDFMENPPKKYHRLSVGKEVRLRYGYVIRCDEVVRDPETQEIVELICHYDPDTLGKAPEGRKVKGVIHWVSATHGKPCKVNLYDRLFSIENPNGVAEWETLMAGINPNSLEVKTQCVIEPNLMSSKPETRFQFERQGYFVLDRHDSTDEQWVFNRIVGLRDSWAK